MTHLKLLGESTIGEESRKAVSEELISITWQVVAGPYIASVTEWHFKDGGKNYTYELDISGTMILSNDNTVMTVEEAVETVENALRDYLVKKAVIEGRFGPVTIPSSILGYRIQKEPLSEPTEQVVDP